ncbi:MAG: hypothetical protein HWN66_09060 [Candidatus Helarchaeota archaeon]|nr:hypothetical protein [Candidatus Helarchaeota archaeon]
MYLILTSTYPFTKQAETEKAFFKAMEKNPTPAYIKPATPLAVRAGRAGIETLAVYEIDKGKIEEATNFIAKALQEYWGIEGYTYELTTWMTGPEAFATIGKKMPE